MNSFWVKIISSAVVWGGAVGSISIWKLKEIVNTSLVFGNYQDYISPELVSEFKQKYNVNFDYFEHDGNLKEKFNNNIYDLSVVSTPIMDELTKSGSIAQIQWEKFEIPESFVNLDGGSRRKKRNVENLSNGDSSKSPKYLNKSDQAEKLFSKTTQSLLATNKDFLKYGIPYFLNKFGFYYTGKKIDALHKKKQDSKTKAKRSSSSPSPKNGKNTCKKKSTPDTVTFAELIEAISKEPRFKSQNNYPKLAIIDDPRTMLSFSRLVAGKKNINPSQGEYQDSYDIFDDYNSLIKKGFNSEKLGNNFLLLNSSSSTLVDSLASGAVNGAFMYNGDGFFAASGGNVDKKYDCSNFHYVNVSDNLISLDFLVFSKNLKGEKLEKAYKLAKDLLFSGYDAKDIFEKTNNSNQSLKEEKLSWVDYYTCYDNGNENSSEEDLYKHETSKNFDHVQYTPTLKNLSEQLFCKHNKRHNYFGNKNNETNKKAFNNLKKSILDIPIFHPHTNKFNREYRDITYYYEQSLDPKTKHDIVLAYEKFKSYL